MGKYAPLFIILLFILATIFIIWGMDSALELAHPKK